MSKISATTVAHSKSPQGHTLWSGEIVLPRFILAELNTHRALSKNSASSRAIPFKKMVEMVEKNPFIPIAWQKEHKGMQGTKYFTDPDEIAELEYYQRESAKEAINNACGITEKGVTKQLANRYLEPFMYHKVLISGTDEGWENFFKLRCPQYRFQEQIFRSRKDVANSIKGIGKSTYDFLVSAFDDDLYWLEMNEGQAEIHMMALAEAIWDAMQESKPKELKAGEWHIPYGDKIDHIAPEQYHTFLSFSMEREDGTTLQQRVDEYKVKISTGMAARTSYTTVGDEKEISYESLIGIHDKMIVADPFHASPFEHCAQVPTEEEYISAVMGKVQFVDMKEEKTALINLKSIGWFRNFRGFKQYRQIIEEK